tara:strand:- start:162 stop:443 length:282 start_codon:yes stop_codon:yes gene_type:complete
MKYKIKQRQFKQAKKLGVIIKPSTLKNKKVDVFKNDKKIASIGASGYKDYATYINERGLEYANKRKKLYKQRHKTNRLIKGSNGYYADKLLWE